MDIYTATCPESRKIGENVDRSSWENSDASTAAVNIVKASPLWIKDDDLSSERVIGGFSKKEISRKMQWTEAEDQIIIYCKATQQEMRWAEISNVLVQNSFRRSGKQCRERWYNQLDPCLKKCSWSETEDASLRNLHKEHGNAWSKLAKLLQGRSENEIKNRWNSVGIKKRASSDALDEVKSGNKNEFNVFNKQSRHSSYSGDSDDEACETPDSNVPAVTTSIVRGSVMEEQHDNKRCADNNSTFPICDQMSPHAIHLPAQAQLACSTRADTSIAADGSGTNGMSGRANGPDELLQHTLNTAGVTVGHSAVTCPRLMSSTVDHCTSANPLTDCTTKDAADRAFSIPKMINETRAPAGVLAAPMDASPVTNAAEAMEVPLNVNDIISLQHARNFQDKIIEYYSINSASSGDAIRSNGSTVVPSFTPAAQLHFKQFQGSGCDRVVWDAAPATSHMPPATAPIMAPAAPIMAPAAPCPPPYKPIHQGLCTYRSVPVNAPLQLVSMEEELEIVVDSEISLNSSHSNQLCINPSMSMNNVNPSQSCANDCFRPDPDCLLLNADQDYDGMSGSNGEEVLDKTLFHMLPSDHPGCGQDSNGAGASLEGSAGASLEGSAPIGLNPNTNPYPLSMDTSGLFSFVSSPPKYTARPVMNFTTDQQFNTSYTGYAPTASVDFPNQQIPHSSTCKMDPIDELHSYWKCSDYTVNPRADNSFTCSV